MKPPRASLKKQEILRGYHTFSRVITEGKSLQQGVVRCFFSPAPRPHNSVRIGFSVSRSVRNAVERNRARRWMKEAYRKNKNLLIDSLVPAQKSTDIVFMLRVRGRLSRMENARAAIDQAIVALLKELHHHLSEKP
ncbi:MAG: ribonuclease P protein component [Ignavibacteriales bacterium]|nr:ribonuclease P protein component [Ignavibacteriales bacterium]